MSNFEQELLDEIKALNGKLDKVIRQNDDIKRILSSINSNGTRIK